MKLSMRITTKILVFSVLMILSLTAFSQKAPMKFGKVPIEDLQMTVYPDDTSAVAAILCNYGYFNSNDFIFTRMMRIKILKKEGTDFCNHVFNINSKSDIRGITYNLENGEVVESKLKSESIFRERVTNEYSRIRIAMPNAKEGSVIDIMYSHPLIPDEWRFQEEIPVRWSELIIEPSPYVDFRKSFYGYVPLFEGSDIRWVVKNVPAFKKEAYMNSIENYISKYEFDIKSISFPGAYYSFTTSWEAVNKRLDENDYFGGTLRAAPFLNNIAKDIESKFTNPMDRMREAFEAVKVVKWNEYVSLYTTQNTLSYPFNKKIGNSADINLILVQLLKKLDFEVYPVAMSSRDNGIVRPYSPSINKLNYVIACVKHQGKNYLLDATEENMPCGLLPLRAINELGRIIDSKNTAWVDIFIDKKDKEMIQYSLALGTDDVLTGKITKTRVDYSAFDFRDEYKTYNSQDEYLKDFEKKNPGLIVENCTIANLDSIYLQIKEDYDVKIKNKVNRVGDMIYINPMLFEQMAENPFKLDIRKYPVDFAYCRESIYMLQLTLPDGYQVSQMPKSLLLKLPDNSASCTYQITNVGNKIMLTYKFLINKAMYVQTEYADLKTLFAEVVKKQAEPVVLKVVQ